MIPVRALDFVMYNAKEIRSTRAFYQKIFGFKRGHEWTDWWSEWYRVIGVESPASLLLAGYLLPPWAGPATSLLRLTLTAVSPTETKLELTDSTFGKITGSELADGWRQIFDEHFRAHLDSKPARRRK